MIGGKYVNPNRESPDFGRHIIPPRSIYCPFCKSLMWIEEKLAASSNLNPKFGICCLQGSIEIPQINQMPNEILQFLKDNKEFRSSIRLYNRILAFTSTSANVDDTLLTAKTGTYTYRINGAVHHKISSFTPQLNTSLKFSQIYIYDSVMQSSLRTKMFPKTIKSNILNLLQKHLEINNPYVKIYMQAGENLRKDPGEQLNIVLKANTTKDKTKNAPVADEIAVLMVDNELNNVNKRDIIITKKITDNDYPLKFVNENLSMYDPLAFPLIHIFGEPGWQYQTYVKHKKDVSVDDNQSYTVNDNVQRKLKYVSAREFYSYRLQDRKGSSSFSC